MDEPTPVAAVATTDPAVVYVAQDQMDMVLGGVLVIVFLLAAILFAQLRRP